MRNGTLPSSLWTLRRIALAKEMSALTDAQLLDRFVHAHDANAFEALVWRHGPTVWSVCRRVLRHEQSAEDAFQATFLTLVRKAKSVIKRASIGSWLYTVAYRVALAARASLNHMPQWEPLAADPPARPDSDAWLWHDLQPVVDEEIDRLPAKYRLPFVLCYIEGKSNRDAARLLGWHTGTLLTRLAWARRQLRRRLSGRGITLSAGLWASLCADKSMAARVPAALAKRAIQMIAADFAVESVTPNVLLLTNGVVRAMLINRITIVCGICLALVAGGVGTGLAWNATAARADAAATANSSRPKDEPAVPRGDEQTSRKSDVELVESPPTKATVQGLVALLNAQAREVQSLQWRDVAIDVINGEEQVGLRGQLVVGKPHSFRLMTRVAGSKVLDMGVNDQLVWLDMPKQMRYMRVCTHAEMALGNGFLTSHPLPPQWLFEVFGLEKRDPDKHYQVVSRDADIELIEEITPAFGKTLQKIVRFDTTESPFTIKGHQLRDAEGASIWNVEFHDWQRLPASWLKLPRRVTISHSKVKDWLKITLGDVTVNDSFTAEQKELLFTRPTDRDQHPRPARGSSRAANVESKSTASIEIYVSPTRIEARYQQQSLKLLGKLDGERLRRLLRDQLAEWAQVAKDSYIEVHIVAEPSVEYTLVRELMALCRGVGIGGIEIGNTEQRGNVRQ